jgi:hypothetical protein
MHQCHLTPVFFPKAEVSIDLVLEIWDFITIIGKVDKVIDGL